MQKEITQEVVWTEMDEQVVSADAYNNCCHFFIGKENAENRD